jgi:hypothetical protein
MNNTYDDDDDDEDIELKMINSNILNNGSSNRRQKNDREKSIKEIEDFYHYNTQRISSLKDEIIDGNDDINSLFQNKNKFISISSNSNKINKVASLIYKPIAIHKNIENILVKTRNSIDKLKLHRESNEHDKSFDLNDFTDADNVSDKSEFEYNLEEEKQEQKEKYNVSFDDNDIINEKNNSIQSIISQLVSFIVYSFTVFTSFLTFIVSLGLAIDLMKQVKGEMSGNIDKEMFFNTKFSIDDVCLNNQCIYI